MKRAELKRCKCGAIVRLVVSSDGTEFWRCLKGHQNGVKKHSEAYKQSHSEFMREVLWQKEGHRETIAEATRAFHTGRKHTKESREKISEALKGEKSWLYGRSGEQHPMFGRKRLHTDESKAKISATQTGKTHTESTREKIRLAGIGRIVSEETRKKQSASMIGKNLGYQHTDEAKKRISLASKGHPVSAEQRQQISKAMKGRTPTGKGAGYGKWSVCLKGHWVRSTWEREAADWFFQRGIQYEYEPERFELGDGLTYVPDFYLPEFNVYYEVKGYRNPKCERQFKLFRGMGHTLHVLDDVWFKQYAQLKQKGESFYGKDSDC